MRAAGSFFGSDDRLDYRLLTTDYRRRVFLLLYAASGAAALVYEVTWTRLLTLQLGHTVAAASTVLAAFMGGLAVGAWFAGVRRTKGPEQKPWSAFNNLQRRAP